LLLELFDLVLVHSGHFAVRVFDPLQRAKLAIEYAVVQVLIQVAKVLQATQDYPLLVIRCDLYVENDVVVVIFVHMRLSAVVVVVHENNSLEVLRYIDRIDFIVKVCAFL
jgi:hypothetical protein